MGLGYFETGDWLRTVNSAEQFVDSPDFDDAVTGAVAR